MKCIILTLLTVKFCIFGFAQNAAAPEQQKVNIQKAIAGLVIMASANFESIKGGKQQESLYSTMYKVTATPELYSQANYINFCKANNKSYFMAYYMLPQAELDNVYSAFIDMPTFGGAKWTFKQVKQEDKYRDASDFVYLAFLYYNGIKVAEFRRNQKEDDANFFLISIGLFDKESTDKPMYDIITHPLDKYVKSAHLTILDDKIVVKDWGAKFDGIYDLKKLSVDSCVSGDCNNGNGRKVLVSVTNNIPHIRIMDGKFKKSVFIGSGDMLIDGEGTKNDGIYEIGKSKDNNNGNHEAKAVFHSSVTNEAIEGKLFGHFTDQFIVCEFNPNWDPRSSDQPKWIKDIYFNDLDLGLMVFYLTKELSDASHKIIAIENANNSSNGSQTNNSVESNNKSSSTPIQKLNIRRTCSTCGGTGKVYHNETEYITYGDKRVATSRRVSETCSACHGRGVL